MYLIFTLGVDGSSGTTGESVVVVEVVLGAGLGDTSTLGKGPVSC